MTKDDALHIFRTFWPEKGYEGIRPHLPDWSKSRASNFASRHGIRMTDEARRELQQKIGEQNRIESRMKECKICEQTKPLVAFFKDIRPLKDGSPCYTSWCIDCKREYDREKSHSYKRACEKCGKVKCGSAFSRVAETVCNRCKRGDDERGAIKPVSTPANKLLFMKW